MARARRTNESARAVDKARAEAAVTSFLRALGLDLKHPDLQGTPARVADAWIGTLVEGYRVEPKRALGRLFESDSRASVVVTEIPFLSTCPHHLLPMRGHAHVALLPDGKIPGFGRIARLVDAFAHRLILQEDLTQSIADALKDLTGAKAAACVIEAQHACVAVTDPARMNAMYQTSAGSGDEPKVARLLREIRSARRDKPSSSSKAPRRKKTR